MDDEVGREVARRPGDLPFDGRHAGDRNRRRRHPLDRLVEIDAPLQHEIERRRIEHAVDVAAQERFDLRRREAGLLEIDVGSVERHHRLERRHRHGAFVEPEREVAANGEVALRAERGVEQLGLDARHLHAPVAQLVLVLNVETVERQRSDIELARLLRRRRGRRRRQVDDVVLVANDVDDAGIDDEVIDGEAPPEHAPRQLDLDAAGDEERAVVVTLRREANVGQGNAAGDRVVAEVSRLEFEVVAREEARGPRQCAAAGHRRVNGRDHGQNQSGGNCRQDDQPAPNPDPHNSILGRESRR